MSLARSSPVAFFRGEVWRVSIGQLVVCWDICIVYRRQGRWDSFIYRERSGALLARYLTHLLRQDCAFFLPRPGDDRFNVVGAQRNPVIPSSALFIPPASSPYLDADEEIDLRATKSPDCLTLQLCQTNQMWRGEPSKLLVAKDY